MFKIYTPYDQLEIKTDDKKPGWFKGYGATFSKDLGNDIIMPTAFDDMLKTYEKSGLMPAMYYSHNTNEPIGDWLSMDVDSKGLKMEGQLWVGKNVTKADQAHMMLQSKTGKGLSIGFSHTVAPTYDDKKGVRYLNGVHVDEVSPTSRPMNPKAGITAVKSLLTACPDMLSVRQAEDALRDVAGWSSDEAKEFIAKLVKDVRRRWDAERSDMSEVRDLLQSIRDSVKL